MGLQYLKVEKRRKTQQRRVKEWLVIDENQECDIQEGKDAMLPQMGSVFHSEEWLPVGCVFLRLTWIN